MPKSVKIVLIINTLILLLKSWLLYNAYTETGLETISAFVLWTLIGGLILCNLFILLKAHKLWGSLRAIIYVVALMQALMVIILLKDFFTLMGFLAVLETFVITFYLIGLRGYLASQGFIAYMKANQDSNGTSV